MSIALCRRASREPVLASHSLSLLDRVQRHVQGATGALSVESSGQVIGIVLLEKGEVCWATTLEAKGRLTELLMESAPQPIERQSLEAAYRRCRSTGGALVPTLAEVCSLTDVQIHGVLLEHTVECLREMARLDVELRFSPHKGSGFGASYSFSYPELYVRMGSALSSARYAHAQQMLAQLVSEGGSGLAFETTRERTLVAFRGVRWVRLADLEELANWANCTLDAATAVGAMPTSVTLTAPNGDAVLLHRNESYSFVLFCSGTTGLARSLTASGVFRRA